MTSTQPAIIGHEKQRQYLRDSLANQRVGHAYLFSGPTGIGRSQVATEFAHALLCESNEAKPCGHCESCLLMTKHSHPDFATLAPEDEGKSITVEDLRQAQRFFSTHPFRSQRKILLIRDGTDLNIQAQQALLKSLEEPPAFAVIILLSRSDDELLPTIISRCQILHFSPLNRTEIRQALSLYPAAEAQTDLLMARFGGRVGPMIAAAKQENGLARVQSDVADFWQMMSTPVAERLQWVNAQNIQDIVSLKQNLDVGRTAIRLAQTKAIFGADTAMSDADPVLANVSRRFSLETLTGLLSETLRIERQSKPGLNYQLQFEKFILSIPSL